jgi:hypothetical protein
MKNSRISVLLATVVIICSSFSAATHAQTLRSDYRGQDFWVCFPENARSENGSTFTSTIYVTGAQGTQVQVHRAGNAQERFTIDSSGELEISVDSSLQVMGSGTISPTGVEIRSSNDVSIICVDHRKASTDSYAAIPAKALGLAYRIAGYADPLNVDNLFSTQADVVATSDGTHVYVDAPSSSEGGKSAKPIVLNRGQVYQFHGAPNTDLTGTLIHADKPVAFFTGHRCAQVPKDISFCNILVEQEPPVTDWGKTFVLPTIQGKDHYSIRVIANEDLTEVTLGGKKVATLKAGKFYGTDSLEGAILLETTKPSLVAMYGQSSQADTIPVGDPFMMIVTPVENYVTSASIGVPHFLDDSRWSHASRDTSVRFIRGALDFRSSQTQGDSTRRVYKDAPRTSKPRKVRVLDYTTLKTKDGVVQLVVEDTAEELHSTPPTTSKASKTKSSGIHERNIVYFADASLNPPPHEASPVSAGAWHNYATITLLSNGVGSVVVDGAQPKSSSYSVSMVPGANYSVIVIDLLSGAHTITSDQPFGIYSFGIAGGGEFDGYGTGAGQMLKITPSY